MPITINDCSVCGMPPQWSTGTSEDVSGFTEATFGLTCGDQNFDAEDGDHVEIHITATSPEHVIAMWNRINPITSLELQDITGEPV